MSLYARIENEQVAEYPIFESLLMNRFPDLPRPIDDNTVLPENYVKVHPRPQSYYRWDAHYVEAAPELDADGKWYQGYNISIFTEEERQAHLSYIGDKIREKRTTLLSNSDWTLIPGSPLTDEQKSLWMVYRQALRDIPSQPGFPLEITWPEKP